MKHQKIEDYIKDLENSISLLGSIKCNNTRLMVINTMKEKLNLIKKELNKDKS